MQKLLKSKRVVSWLVILTMLITLLPSNLVANAAVDPASRKVSDLVEANIGGEKLQLDLYANGLYEAEVVPGSAISNAINAATGSAITVSVNGQVAGTTTCPPNMDASRYIRYDSKTGIISNVVEKTNTVQNQNTAIIVHVEKPTDWASINLYAYNVNGTQVPTPWPGQAMIDEGNGFWTVTVPTSSNASLIFNDGSGKQTVDITGVAPGEYWFTDGVVGDGGYTFKQNTTNPNITAITVHVEKPTDWASINLYAWVNDVKLVGDWPGQAMTDEGNGFWTATVPTSTNASLIFNNGSGQQTVNMTDVAPGEYWYTDGVGVDTNFTFTKNTTNPNNVSIEYNKTAAWAGNLDVLGTEFQSWKPEDSNAELDYLGGGIFAKTFNFTTTTTDINLQYKVAYNDSWNQGEIADNISLTIPAGTSSITIFADTNTNYVTDSITNPNIAKVASLIGTVRELGADDWTITLNGWEMKHISKDYYSFSKVFATPGTYQYKCVLNYADYPSWSGNKSITTTQPNTNVVFLYNAADDNMYDSVNNYDTVASALGFPTSDTPVIPGDPGTEITEDTFVGQPGGTNIWRVTGSLGTYDSWNLTNPNSVMTHLVGEYYVKSMVLDPGLHEFKFTKNGSWDNAIGSNGISNNSQNFSFTLTERTKVNFYLNDELQGLDKVRTNISGITSINQYTPERTSDNWPRLVGSLQTELGESKDWEPSTSTHMFVDYYFNNTVYKIQGTLPQGDYQSKVVCGNSWNGTEIGNSSGGDMTLKIIDSTANVTFSVDYSASTKELTHNYKPIESLYDGVIDKNSLYFDSRSITYKKPFGAIKQGQEDVTFRIAAKTQDAQLVKLELIDYNGISKTYNMFVSTIVDGKDYWEVTVPKEEFNAIGIWGYKFIIIDGTTKVEYGDDGLSGGTGAVAEDGQTPYNLTVYANDYKTPDWMKNAVVYQIFPDRFFDGDTTNNHAKDVDGTRGDDVQLFDGDKWSTLPENPRQSEEANKPYYPDATTDGVWTNEFYGGDIAGVREKLSYLQTIGVNTIYLNPVSWAASNHKYDATDYRHLDPMFGKPVYNTLGDPASGLNYEATKVASDKVYSDFAKVCDELGIHLISDGVFNHVGDDSIYFDRYEKYPEIGAYEYWSKVWDEVEKNNVTKEQAEATVKAYFKAQINPATGKNYTDSDFGFISWFNVGPEKYLDENGNFVRYQYDCWWGFDSLPAVNATEANETNLTNDSNATIEGKHEYNTVNYRENVIGYDLNQSNITDKSAAMQKANSQRWLWMGSNGWRLDVAPDVSDDTWKQFRTAVKSATGKTDVNGNVIDDPVILGEEWNVATHYLLGDMFDSVMNYQFRAALQNFIASGADASTLNTSLEIIRENYPKEAWQAMLNLVDSHDTIRNITKIDNPSWEEENIKDAPDASDKAIKLQALTGIFQLSYPGAPTIYYGDEVGVTGTKDPDSRRTFPWERVTENTDGSYNVSSSYDSKYGDLFDSYVTAASVRHQYEDLFATGDIMTAYANGDVIAYARKSATKGGLSVINKSDAAVEITANVKDFLQDGLTLEDKLGSGLNATVTNGTIALNVPAYTGLMMVSTTDLATLPAAPSNLTASASEGPVASVDLTWNAVDGVTGYDVYRTTLEGTTTTKITSAPITETTYTDNDVINGTRYFYYVKSVAGDTSSVYSNVTSGMPSYLVTSISKPTDVTIDTIGVGKKTSFTTVEIQIPGITGDVTNAGKEVPGLIASLAYYKEGDSVDSALKARLRYSGDTASGKTYTAAFEPTEAGTYHYLALASMNNGATYTVSDETTVVANAVSPYTLPTPKIPVLEQPVQESSRVTLNWSLPEADSNISGFDIYRVETDVINSPEYKIATVASSATTFTDFLVNNDTSYTYRIEAFNNEYNRSESNSVTIIPKLTMVDVTIRLTIPDKVYTSATDNIYIASDVNGWNEAGWLLKKPSGATNSNIVEYTFQMMAGTQIQYKYTRGAWVTEGFTSRNENDTTSPGNYAYSSTDTNIHLTVTNQGGNKMLVNDYVLRWVDMPIMITVPRISFKGETIEYTTTDSTFNLQASVPYGGICTISGEDINTKYPDALDEYGNIRVDNIPLKEGVNEFELHVEPTAETKSQPWFTDTGRANQMSGTTIIRITRTTATDPTDPTNPTNPTEPTNPTNPTKPTKPTDSTTTPTVVVQGEEGWNNVSEELSDIIANLDDKTSDDSKDSKKTPDLIVDMTGTTVLPAKVLETIKGQDVEISLDFGDYTWNINGSTIKDNADLTKGIDLKVSDITNKNALSGLDKATETATKNSNIKSEITPIKQFDIAYDGALPFEADLQIKVGDTYAGKYVYLNYYNEKTKKLEVSDYAKVDKEGYVSLTFKHASSYVLTEQNIVLPTVVKTKSMQAGKSYTLKVSNKLADAKVTYSSSNKSIATISKTGKITAKKAGIVTITVKVVQAGKTYKYTTKVTIKK